MKGTERTYQEQYLTKISSQLESSYVVRITTIWDDDL